jgi:Tfp pilus assembly protein PilF
VQRIAPICLSILWISFQSAALDSAQSKDSSAPTPPNASATAEYTKLQAADEAAQAEVDAWLRQNKSDRQNGKGVSESELQTRISKRFESVQKGYEDFLSRYPSDAKARLDFGNFLNDRQDERRAQLEWEKALQLDPTNAVIYNNLAGRYSESGPVDKAFEYFAKAIQLSPTNADFHHNFGDCLYVLRKPAATYYHITEQEVYGKALLCYSNALLLVPLNYAFARDFAQTYYSVKPLPINQALQAWTNALQIAREEPDREDACVHLARVKMLAGRFAEARAQLQTVTNETLSKAKSTLLHNLEEREKGPR